MNKTNTDVKNGAGFQTAPLRNLAIIETTLLKSVNRARHLPGLTTFSGPSGFGKSTAAAYIASKYTAAYVEVRSLWNKKNLLQAIAQQLGLPILRTNNDMLMAIGEELAVSQRPLILDEFDNAVDRNLVEIVRDIFAMSESPIILIGEEGLPQKLERWERFHGRVLEWAQAQPADIRDAKLLNKHYVPDIVVADDLLEKLLHQAKGSVRRVVTNLERIHLFAKAEGLQKIDAATWGNRELYSGKPPAGRRF